MARIFIDGFESGDHDMWDAEDNATVIASGNIDGSYILDCNDYYEYLQKSITAVSEMYFAFIWRPASATYSRCLLTLFNSGTSMIRVGRNYSTNEMRVFVGAVEVADSSIVTPTENTNYLMELWVTIANSGGRIVLKMDGVTVIDFTGDTQTGADTQFNQVRLGSDGVDRTNCYFDNFIMDDASWIGDTNIQAVVPTGAGNTTGWTPSVGNNWECVDEKPASDVDYVSINANDITDTYVTGNLAGTIGAVKCVQVQSRMRADGAPTPTNLKLVVRSGAADYLSGNKAVLVSEKSLWNLWETDPADAGAWTEADVNAMEIGIKSAA